MILSARDERRLVGVHPMLRLIVHRAARDAELPFTVLEGVRTLDRQRALVAAGASWTLRSRHLTGHAVDLAALVDGVVRWDWPLYPKLNEQMQAAAAHSKLHLIWGGDWRSRRDGPHWELPRLEYPAD